MVAFKEIKELFVMMWHIGYRLGRGFYQGVSNVNNRAELGRGWISHWIYTVNS